MKTGEPGAQQQHIQAERTLLLSGDKERPGYGLYSYLLMPTKPMKESREKAWEELIEVVLSEVNESKISRNATQPASTTAAPSSTTNQETQRLNILYIPILKQGTSEEEKSASWVAKNYNYDLAERLSILIYGPDASSRGPYLVSSLFPFRDQQRTPAHCLKMDFTNIPLDVASSSIDVFKSEAASPRYWTPNEVKRFSLLVVTWISETVRFKKWKEKDPKAGKELKESVKAG